MTNHSPFPIPNNLTPSERTVLDAGRRYAIKNHCITMGKTPPPDWHRAMTHAEHRAHLNLPVGVDREMWIRGYNAQVAYQLQAAS